MITFKAIIIPNNRRKDGTYPVKIRVTFKGVSRRLPTTLVCSPGDLTRSLKIKSADILNHTDELITRMRNAVKGISPFDLENWDVDRVVSHIKSKLTGESFTLDFFEWGDQYIQGKSVPTKLTYSTALNAFERFLGERRIDINDISRSMLQEYMDFVDNEPKMHHSRKTGKMVECKTTKIPRSASSRYLIKLQHIFNAAKNRYNDEDSGRILIPRSPFNNIVKIIPPSQGQKSLGVDLMQRIIKAQTSDPSIRIALDAFIISFGLMGANMVDLYYAIPFDGLWIYNRQKTMSRRQDKAEMRVEIPAEVRPYIERLQDRRRAWWLSVLHEFGKDANYCTARVNRNLKRWCKANGVQEFTFYAARHTWATLARKAGIEKATIDDCLAHKGDFLMADIYAEKSWDLIWEANRKVLGMFDW